MNNLTHYRMKHLEEKVQPNGCAMMYFEFNKMQELHDMIDKDDVYDEDGFGLEDEPHCTLLYGLHSDVVKGEEVVELISTFDKGECILHNASLFENDYDVLKFDVDCDVFHKINKKLTDSYPYSTDYPDYHPHATVGYLKKGKGAKYVKLLKELKYKVQPNKIVYSSRNREKIERPI